MVTATSTMLVRARPDLFHYASFREMTRFGLLDAGLDHRWSAYGHLWTFVTSKTPEARDQARTSDHLKAVIASELTSISLIDDPKIGVDRLTIGKKW
ncbi:hypothetical protein [Rhizobium sp. YTU87027]|uniref:hypothetical protein n=1 Tax=Rhizobium sp. YTU87027 TaxID=3417741 RepID=UPI003D685E60